MVAEAKQSTLDLVYKTTIGWLQRLSGYVVSLIRGPKEEEVGLSLDAADEKQELQRLLNRDVVMRRGIIVIVIALGGFLAWATLAPLTEGVVAMGTVVVDTEHKTIQHLEGGIVENLYVREGSEVKAGDVLIELSETQNRAQLELLESRYYGRLAEIDRLNAERLLQDEIAFSDELLVLRDEPFVEAATIAGWSRLRIAFRHVLPNALGPAASLVSVMIGFSILLTAGLSFVGAGVRLPTAEWGVMISEGSNQLGTGEWWPSVFPGLSLAFTIFGFSLLGEGLREAPSRGGSGTLSRSHRWAERMFG